MTGKRKRQVMERERCAAIVLAAGSGKRMNSSVKKQYIEIYDHPVLYYSLRAFETFGIDEIVLVTGKDEIEYCRKEIVKRYGFANVSAIVAGGKERYHSVYEGLKAVKSCQYVFIHDGARPCINQETLNNCLKDVREYGACVAAVPVKDTIKIADKEGFAQITPERSKVWAVQTPQVFEYDLIKKAYEIMFASSHELKITDDAMVVENFTDKKVKLTNGSYQNIKVTTPDDLPLAQIYLMQNE